MYNSYGDFMQKIEYKKINYVFSVNSNIEESIKKLSLTDESKLFISRLINEYKNEISNNIISYKYDLDSKKKLLIKFNETIPRDLMILRNHIKNCTYVNSIADFNYKYKAIEEDFKRLNYIK